MLSLDAVVCSGSSLSAVSVQTYDMELGNSLQFVLFDQEPTSVSAIYSSGNVIASVSPDVNGIATLTALNGLFVNTGTQPVTRYIYARVLPSPIDALCRPYARIAIQVMPAINFMASIVPPTCIGTQAQPNGQLLISGFDPSYHYSVAANAGSLLTDYNTAPPIPNNGVISNQLVSPSAATTYTVRILAPGNCFLDKQVVLNPVNCLCQTPDCVPLKVRKIK